jgi:hypothetical protein
MYTPYCTHTVYIWLNVLVSLFSSTPAERFVLTNWINGSPPSPRRRSLWILIDATRLPRIHPGSGEDCRFTLGEGNQQP